MSLSDGAGKPQAPTLYAVYRGFYILPTDVIGTSIIAIDFFVSRSSDNLTYDSWQYLGRSDSNTGLYFVHSGLDENTYYAYYVQYIYSDGSKGPVGNIAYPGQAELIISSSLNVDQLASKAYKTGLVTSGIFQGVIFRTASVDPKVQMDPTGIWAEDAQGTKVFYIHADGSPAIFQGVINSLGLTIPASILASTPVTQANRIVWTAALSSQATPTAADIYGADQAAATHLNVTDIVGAGTNDASIGSFPWQFTSNITVDDGNSSIANNSLITPEVSNYLFATNLGFSVPSDAIILGVSANVRRQGDLENTISDNSIRLIKAGAVVGTSQGQAPGNYWTGAAAPEIFTYGGSTNLWGTTLTPTDVNSSRFGLAISVAAIGVGGDFGKPQDITANVYDVYMTVYYSVVVAAANAELILRADPGGVRPVSSVAASAATDSVTIIDNSGNSSFLQLATSQNVHVTGPYDTGVLGGTGIGQFFDTNTTITHNRGTTALTAFGNLYDGNWAGLCSWRAFFSDANNVLIAIGNNSNRASVTAGLKFWLIG